MVTEILVWALLVTDGHKRPMAVEVYNSELLCRQDMREVRQAVPDAVLACAPRRSMARPQQDKAGVTGW